MQKSYSVRDLARGGNFPFSRLEFQRAVWGLVVKYSKIFMDLTKDARRFFFPYKEHVRLFRSLKFFRPLTVRSMRLLFVVAAAYATATYSLLGFPPEILQYLQLISQT
jgi:hypothetical protein